MCFAPGLPPTTRAFGATSCLRHHGHRRDTRRSVREAERLIGPCTGEEGLGLTDGNYFVEGSFGLFRKGVFIASDGDMRVDADSWSGIIGALRQDERRGIDPSPTASAPGARTDG